MINLPKNKLILFPIFLILTGLYIRFLFCDDLEIRKLLCRNYSVIQGVNKDIKESIESLDKLGINTDAKPVNIDDYHYPRRSCWCSKLF